MKKLIISLLFILSIVLIPNINYASLRWGNDLIQIGEYSCVILQKCGEPKYKEIIRKGIKQSKIEHWLYEKKHGFYYVFIFKDGVLTEIKAIRK